MDALLNHAAKVEYFSGGAWKVPLVIRAACGGWYGDGGQHEQSLGGWLAHIPGLAVVAPSTPADAAGLMLSAVAHDAPVVYLEPKLLSNDWLESLGSGGRSNVAYDVPRDGAEGPVPQPLQPVPLGKARIVREGKDIAIVSAAVGVHRAVAAASVLEKQGASALVLDLRSLSPLDREAVREAAAKTGRLLVVDEDYRDFGLSGEIAATVLEAGIPAKFARVCVEDTIPYDRVREEEALPNAKRIIEASERLLG
jgi:pyruvate dehydrogenase E1 component beta subunit